VLDRMTPRWRRTIDFYLGDVSAAAARFAANPDCNLLAPHEIMLHREREEARVRVREDACPSARVLTRPEIA